MESLNEKKKRKKKCREKNPMINEWVTNSSNSAWVWWGKNLVLKLCMGNDLIKEYPMIVQKCVSGQHKAEWHARVDRGYRSHMLPRGHAFACFCTWSHLVYPRGLLSLLSLTFLFLWFSPPLLPPLSPQMYITLKLTIYFFIYKKLYILYESNISWLCLV